MFRSLVFWCSVLMTLGPVLLAEAPVKLVDLVGERLEFQIRWGPIHAGEATMEVLAEGEEGILLRATARSNEFIDLFYPVRDLIESRLENSGARVQTYRKQAQEGRGPERLDEIRFDYGTSKVYYSRDGQEREPIALAGGVQDPLSSLYAYRVHPQVGEGTVAIDVTDGKRLITGEIVALRRETVDLPAGRFETIVVEPRLEGIGGIFRRSPGATILVWLTDDEFHRPVKMESRVAIGSVTVELTALGEEKASPPSQISD